MLLGAVTVHFGNGRAYTNANGGWEYAALLSAASIAQALLGDGAFALRFGGARESHTPAQLTVG